MSPRPAPLMTLTAVPAFILGGAVSALAFYVARYGPAEDSWSFRGNGALAVYLAVPGVLAGGWTALARRSARRSRWALLGLGAGALGISLGLADAALLPLFGQSADQTLGPFLILGAIGWMILAPLLAHGLTWGAADRWFLAAGLVWLVAAIAGLVVIGIIIPAGS